MDFITAFSEIIGNPTEIRAPENYNTSKFEWQGRVRAVLPDGSVTPVGYYDGYGRIVVGNNTFNLDEKVGRGVGSGEAFMIIDYVYGQIIKHKKFKEEMNLYKMIKKYSPFTDRQTKLLGFNTSRPSWYLSPKAHVEEIGRDAWKYTDPSISTKSRGRIDAIVDHFMNSPIINKMIKWEKKFVKNMPSNDAGTLNNFRDGNKVVQYKVGNLNKYMSQSTFTRMTKMSPNMAYNKPNNRIIFKNPFTRENVKVGDIKFVILKNAATKIQSVVRGKAAKIQSVVRGKAATKIQSVVRGKKARNVVQKPKVTTQRKKPVVREKMTRQDIERALRAKAQKARVSVVQERNAVARRKLLANAAARRK